MFRRTSVDIPKDVTFEAELKAHGLTRNDQGQYVHIDQPHNFYEFKKYKDANTNEQRNEAIHKAISEDVFAELDALRVRLHYLHQGETGIHGSEFHHNFTTSKPYEAFIKILATEFGHLAKKKEVLLVVGDSKQPLGILSWAQTTTAGGINAGTVVGLVKALREKAAGSVTESLAESDIPGVVILNPGQLLFSHQSCDCLSAAEWQNRARTNAFSEPHTVSAANKVAGHEDMKTHVHTFLNNYLHLFVRPDQRLHIIAIGDGGDAVLSGLEDLLPNDHNSTIRKSIRAISLIQSTHSYDLVKSFAVQRLLLRHGRAWEASPQPKGTVLAKPPTELEHAIYAEEAKHRREAPEDESTYKHRHDVATLNERCLAHTRNFVRPRARPTLVAFPMDGSKLAKEWEESKKPILSDSYEHFMSVTMPRKVERMRLDREEYKDTNDAESQANVAPVQQASMEGQELDRSFKFPASGNPSRTSSKSSLSSAGVFYERNIITGWITEYPERSRPRSLVDLGELEEVGKEHKREAASPDASDDDEWETESEEDSPQATVAEPVISESAVMQHGTVPASPVIRPASGSADPVGEPLDLNANPSFLDLVTAASGDNDAGQPNEAFDYYGQPHNCTTVSAGIEGVCEDIFPAVRDDVLEFFAKHV